MEKPIVNFNKEKQKESTAKTTFPEKQKALLKEEAKAYFDDLIAESQKRLDSICSEITQVQIDIKNCNEPSRMTSLDRKWSDLCVLKGSLVKKIKNINTNRGNLEAIYVDERVNELEKERLLAEKKYNRKANQDNSLPKAREKAKLLLEKRKLDEQKDRERLLAETQLAKRYRGKDTITEAADWRTVYEAHLRPPATGKRKPTLDEQAYNYGDDEKPYLE